MDKYEITFCKNGEEIELSAMPKEYLSGIIKLCRAEISRAERWEHVCQNMANGISNR